MDINKDEFEKWYSYAKQLEYETTLMKANIEKLEDEVKFHESEYKNARKHHEECLAFIALEGLLPKYYDWVRENFWKDIIEKV